MPLYRHTKVPPPPELGEKTVWDYLPRGSTRRVLFLLLALGAVLFLKHAGGWSLGGLLDAPRGTVPGADPGAPVYHIKVTPAEDPNLPKMPKLGHAPTPPVGPTSKSAP